MRPRVHSSMYTIHSVTLEAGKGGEAQESWHRSLCYRLRYRFTTRMQPLSRFLTRMLCTTFLLLSLSLSLSFSSFYLPFGSLALSLCLALYKTQVSLSFPLRRVPRCYRRKNEVSSWHSPTHFLSRQSLLIFHSKFSFFFLAEDRFAHEANQGETIFEEKNIIVNESHSNCTKRVKIHSTTFMPNENLTINELVRMLFFIFLTSNACPQLFNKPMPLISTNIIPTHHSTELYFQRKPRIVI